jgi:hypothetical protein
MELGHIIMNTDTKDVCYVLCSTYFFIFLYCPPLWSSGQSSWLQIQRSGFDSRRYQISWKVVGLEWGPLSLVSTSEELLERNSSRSGLEIREHGRGDPLRWPRGTIFRQKLALTLATTGGRSFGIVRSLTQAIEFSFYSLVLVLLNSLTNRFFSFQC